MKRLLRKASDITVGDTATVDFGGQTQQFIVEDVHINEICGTVKDEEGNQVSQCFDRPEIINFQKGIDPNQPAQENPGEEGAQPSGDPNPFDVYLNEQVQYRALLPAESGSGKVYPTGTIIKTGYDGVGYYATLRSSKGKDYTIREEDINKIRAL